MSWVGIANNQTVSFNNLQDAVTNGYFVALAGIPASQEQITKSDASTYVILDTAYAPFAAKTSNQLVVKSNLRPISYSYTIYYRIACVYDGTYEGGAGSSDQACSNTLTITLYSPSSTFQNGMKLFYDAACTGEWYGDTGGCGQYYKVIIGAITYSFTYPNSGSTVQNLSVCSSACSCFYLQNTDSVDISIQFYDCQYGLVCNICPAGSTIYLCIQDSQQANYTVSYGTNCSDTATPSYVFSAMGGTCIDPGNCI